MLKRKAPLVRLAKQTTNFICNLTFVKQLAVHTLLSVFLFAATCSVSADATNSPQVKKVACPGWDFHIFLSQFSNIEAIQRTYVIDPLIVQVLDPDTEPEPQPQPITRKTHYRQLKFPIMPLAAERKEKSLVLRIDKVTDRNAEVTLLKEDTGYRLSYFFVKTGCWRLVRIEDWSL